MEPDGRVALVTGGARRVGRTLSTGLARAGCRVVVNYHRSADEARDAVREIESAGGCAVAVQGDVSSTADVRRLVDAARESFGGLDILVNNASTFERAAFEDIDERDWDRVLAVNLKGPFLLARAAAPLLRARGAGLIINIADLSAFQAWPSHAHHAVSKAGLVHLTRVLARALAPEVRANCIAPGTVLPPDDYQGEDYAGGRDRRTVARPGSPEDVLDALLYFVRSDFVTGQTLIVDGGRMLL